jgi:pimeloyl-ACP methyl ester carboxylesterase
MPRKTKIIAIIFGSLLFVCLLYVGFYAFQDHFIFQSEKLPADYVFTFDQKFEELVIPTTDGEQISALLFRADSSRGLILYFHGNAGSLQRWGQYATDFTSLGYDILMMDYRGYGKSTGTPNEENLYQDAQTVLQWSGDNLTYQKLVIYGRSLGSAVAANLATTAPADLLILETPFEELNDVLYFLSSQYKFPNKTFLPKINCKRVIFQGTHDDVVPLASALKLRPFLDEQDRFVIIEGGGHNNLREFKEYRETLREVLN